VASVVAMNTYNNHVVVIIMMILILLLFNTIEVLSLLPSSSSLSPSLLLSSSSSPSSLLLSSPSSSSSLLPLSPSYRVVNGPVISSLPQLELHQVLLYQYNSSTVLAFDFLPHDNKNMVVLIKLLSSLDQPGCRRIRIFNDITIDDIISTRNEWIADNDANNLYDIVTQKDIILTLLLTHNNNDYGNDSSSSSNSNNNIIDMINMIYDEERFNQINLYKRNCIHFVNYLIRLQKTQQQRLTDSSND